jgi:hypothetical protein
MAVDVKTVWEAQPGPQTALIACPVFEIFYGGARGGGKTDGMLGDWLEHSARWGEAAVGVFFRRTFRQLSEVIARSQQIFPKLGAQYRVGDAEWRMANGARLLFRYLERDADAENYQGHSYTRVYFEEITNFPTPAPIDKLRATLRSAVGADTGLRATGNPGGPGHTWVKKRYIDPNPHGYQVITENFANPFDGSIVPIDRVFIPARLSDNALLIKNDPLYVAKLQQAGSKQLVQAWLMGEWDMVDGAFFDEWDTQRHVLPAEWLGRIPDYSKVFRAFDWGFAKPFSCGWYAVSDGKWGLPRGAMLRFNEWYGSNGQPNVGLRLDAGLVGAGIRKKDLELEQLYGLRTSIGYADPSIFTRDGGPRIAEAMLREGVVWTRADNKRIPGWQQVRRRLVGNEDGPLLYILETCEDTIRTLPFLQHDDRNPEDLDTDGEDHAGDEVRYACMSRPVVVDKKATAGLELVRLPGQLTFNDVLAMNRRRRIAEAQG